VSDLETQYRHKLRIYSRVLVDMPIVDNLDVALLAKVAAEKK
jgi:hypothetical protein|tara:strand:- start:1354 stop:1479 length:126 start_codon:yes stop_codon:yes gene_type:complete